MILNRNLLKNVIEGIINPFKELNLSKEEKTLIIFLNSSIYKQKLAKGSPTYKEIKVKQKDLNSLIFPKLTDSDLTFYAKIYDYLYFIQNEKTKIFDYFENTHLKNLLLDYVNYFVLEILFPEKLKIHQISFREYFDEHVSLFDLDHKSLIIKEDGYLYPINEENKIKLISNLYHKRIETYDRARNNVILCEIELKSFLKEISFFEYKYTNYK